MAKVKFLIFLPLFFVFSVNSVWAQPVNINGLDMTYIEENGKKLYRINQASFEQQGTNITCNRADYDKLDNVVYCYENVVVTEASGTRVTGNYLKYDADNKVAQMDGGVVLTDKDLTLTTPSIQYNTAAKTGLYTSGGRIVDGENTLTSRVGIYNSNSKMLFFRHNVVLINPQYSMKGDTLQYNTTSRTAFFYGPTIIKSEDNTIYCNYGWYNTRSGKSQFSKHAVIISKENTISADSMLYNRNDATGAAFGDIVLEDSIQKVNIFGQKGTYNRNSKNTMITGKPVARQWTDNDTLMLKADTFLYIQDTLGKRHLSAYKNAGIFKPDLSAVADSLVYLVEDSMFRLFYDPVLWNDNNQVSADTIQIFIKNSKVNLLKMKNKSMIIQEESPGRYNQISGVNMDNYFDQNKLKSVNVLGNGISIYYLKENDSLYTGVNYINCENMKVELDSSRIKNIRFYNQPKGTLFPLNELPADKKQIPGFVWRAERKPTIEQFAITLKQKEKQTKASIKKQAPKQKK